MYIKFVTYNLNISTCHVVIVDLQRVFHLHLGTFRTYIHTRFHIHIYSGLLGITMKPSAKIFAQLAHYFTFQEKASHFSKIYYHVSFQWPKLYGVKCRIHMTCYY